MDKVVFSEQELKNIKKALKGWENVTFDKIKVDSAFGLVNRTFVVKALDPEVHPPAVFYRIFGDLFGGSNRKQENKVFREIAKAGLGPQCYDANLDYRIEEYIPSHVVSPKELHTPEISNAIAKWQAGLHKQNFDFLGADKNIISTLSMLEGENVIKKAEETLRKTDFSDEDKEIVELLKTVVNEEEFNLLKKMLPQRDKNIVFSQNDPNMKNIIMVEETGKPMVVDYETCGYNFRAYDVSVFFIFSRINLAHPEPPYFHVDHTKFKTNEEMKGYIRRYLLFFRHDWKTIDEEKALVDDEYLKEYILKNNNLDDFEAEVDDILRECFVCAMLSQLGGIVSVINMDINLPYSKYLITKASYDCYMEFKEKAKVFPLKVAVESECSEEI